MKRNIVSNQHCIILSLACFKSLLLEPIDDFFHRAGGDREKGKLADRRAEVFQEGLGSRVGWQSMKTIRRWKLLWTGMGWAEMCTTAVEFGRHRCHLAAGTGGGRGPFFPSL